ncbi:MAG: sigma-54-dependent transcriptional regulator [Chloroflexota bacterium]|nr:sigma-54 dependent transcriptional regulator [Lentimicrobium sp.]
MNKILIVDDDATFSLMLKTFLGNKGFEVSEVYSANKALKILKEQKFDVVLSDFRLPDFDGLELISEIHKIIPAMPIILMTRYGDIRSAVNAIKSGAYDYVTKPVNPDDLLTIIHSTLQHDNNEKPVKQPVAQENSGIFIYMRGTSDVAQHVENYINIIAPTEMSVIIQGESGTGKEYVARMVHIKSPRNHKPFIAVDCGALTNELAASELFGHVKGAFTDAQNEKEGQFQLANGGTLFLDEIGNLSYENQLKLLRATQERKVHKMGSNKEEAVDVRILAATNEDLIINVQKGTFREDLFHRLNEFSIYVPPLRDRGEDILQFANYFLEIANRELDKDVKGFDKEVIERLLTYSWPGNIREIKNVIRRAVLLASTGLITKHHLPSIMFISEARNEQSSVSTTDLKSMAESQEKATIMSVLRKTYFNKTKAAQLLNIDRKTLYNKIKLYGLEE